MGSGIWRRIMKPKTKAAGCGGRDRLQHFKVSERAGRRGAIVMETTCVPDGEAEQEEEGCLATKALFVDVKSFAMERALTKATSEAEADDYYDEMMLAARDCERESFLMSEDDVGLEDVDLQRLRQLCGAAMSAVVWGSNTCTGHALARAQGEDARITTTHLEGWGF